LSSRSNRQAWRRRPVILAAVAIGLGLGFQPGAHADGGSAVTGAFALLEPGGRGPALAGAVGPIVDDPTAIYWNPARLTRVDRPGLAVTYADLYDLDLVHHTGLFLAWPRQPRGIGWESGKVTMRHEPARSAWGLSVLATTVDLQPDTYSEYDIGLAMARRGTWGIDYAVVLHGLLVRSDLEGTDATGYALDLALARPIVAGLQASVVMRSLFSSLNWEGSDTETLIPRVHAGLGWAPHACLRIPIEATWDLEQALLQQAAAGAEWSPWGGTLSLRAGARWRDDGETTDVYPAAGLGVRWMRIAFDYGWAAGREELGDTHRLGLGYQF